MSDKPKSLAEKILLIMDELSNGMQKKGKVRGGMSYSYLKGEDAMKKFRELQLKYKVIVIASKTEKPVEVISKGDKGFISTVDMVYKIINAENPSDLYVSVIPGQGYDATDKGVYKAMTGAYKYFILQTFSASTDDPEKQEAGKPAVKTNSRFSG